MKFIACLCALFMAPQLLTALPTPQPQTFDTPILNIRDIPSSDVDLPAFITAIFDGLANVIAASGAAAANTIAATGGAVANGLGTDGVNTPSTINSTLVGRSLGEQVGRAVAGDLTDALTGKRRV